MKIERIRQVSASERIADVLTREIIAGEWAPGEALPSLRELSESFGVSSPTVREAVQALKGRGLLESRQGSGTYVKGPDNGETVVPWMLQPREAGEFLELNEARDLIERTIITLAASRRSASELERINSVLESMQDAREHAARFLEADLEFHVAVAEAAHNRILVRTMLALRGPLKRLMAARMIRDLERDGNLDEAIRDHEDIVRALERSDPEIGYGALERITGRGAKYLEELEADPS